MWLSCPDGLHSTTMMLLRNCTLIFPCKYRFSERWSYNAEGKIIGFYISLLGLVRLFLVFHSTAMNYSHNCINSRTTYHFCSFLFFSRILFFSYFSSFFRLWVGLLLSKNSNSQTCPNPFFLWKCGPVDHLCCCFILH